MKLPNISSRKFQHILLLLFPALYGLAGFYFRTLAGDLSLFAVDPEFIYLFSGLSISQGIGDIGHMDNPGTPLQVFTALIFRLVWLFRPGNTSYLEDVLSEPDFYLNMVNLSLTLMVVAAVLFAGKAILDITGSVLTALLFQTLPFLPVIWYDIIGRIMPELFFPVPLLLLSVFILKYYARPYDSVNTRDVFYLAFLSALGLSIKLTFLPLWVIPLFIIKSFRKKAIFLFVSVLMFLIIAFPVTYNISYFWKWTRNLFIHSGRYGGGEANFLDPETFLGNLKFFLHWEKSYLFILSFSTLAFIAYFFIAKKRFNTKWIRITSGILLASIFQIFIVCKHFAHHYLIPSMMLIPLLVFMAIEILNQYGRQKKWISVTTSLILVGFLSWKTIDQFHWIRVKSDWIGSSVERRQATKQFTCSLEKDAIRIIATHASGCPFPEFGMINGYSWAGKVKPVYQPYLQALYPDSYFYFLWDNSFVSWNEAFDPEQIISSERKVYLYIENTDESFYQKVVDKLTEITNRQFGIDREHLYTNPETSETLFRLSFSSKGNNGAPDV